ncbi:uncharacterized protein LOC107360010 [Tetranychus urticae]|uniref:FYVE-type zinc finger domain-containing protein n=1 Tax=Tetranychus urticae TaxID=32264 RepID=T1K3J7_TETUR|nr:uncharacterized protein LOC107360010 [Tetranychus urticae]XP_025016066.1 uncharacterized protein LOC107360010 [Tetranychus urticae]
MEPESSDDQPKRRLIRANISLRLSTSFDDDETRGLSEAQSLETTDDPFSEEEPEGEENDELEKDDLLNEHVHLDDSLMEQGIMHKSNIELENDYEYDDDDDDDEHQIDSHKDELGQKPDVTSDSPAVKFSDRLFSKILKLSKEAKSSPTGSIKGSTLASKMRKVLEDFQTSSSSRGPSKAGINYNQDTRGWYNDLMSFISSQDNFDPATMTLDNLQKLRSVMCKAERASLSVTKEMESDLVNHKICFICLKVRFNLIKWSTRCKICSQTMCDKCTVFLSLPHQPFSEITVDQIEASQSVQQLSATDPGSSPSTSTSPSSLLASVNEQESDPSTEPSSMTGQDEASSPSVSPLPYASTSIPRSPRHLASKTLPNILRSLSIKGSDSLETIKVCKDCKLFIGKLRKMKATT